MGWVSHGSGGRESRGALYRVRSVLTQAVKVIEVRKVNTHAIFLKVTSGQLRFLG
jgi:hypothetical protein